MKTQERVDWFSPEESAALLHHIFPHYPDLRGYRPVTNPAQFLKEYRASKKQ
jgi:hypothetical protein